MVVSHFVSAAEFRCWLEINHAAARELYVGFYKKGSGRAGLTYAQAVDEALCFGWIDGIIRKIDEYSYCHRFSPRRTGSIWSHLNLEKVARLTKTGLMRPAGTKAFAARRIHRTGIYTYELGPPRRRPQYFPPALESVFRDRKLAWTHWQAQPPGYQRVAIHWVTSAKHEATRQRRLAELIAINARGQRLGGK